MKQHRQIIRDSLSNCTPCGRALFALLCAERLRSCCRVYQNTTSLPVAAYFDDLDAGFASLLKKKNLSPEASNLAVERLDACVPEGGDPLSVQAQSGVVCLMEALRLLAGGEVEGCIEVVNAIVDALDNYHFFIRRRLCGDTTSPDDYILLRRESDRQLADVRTAKTFDQLSESDLVALRIENLQFAVPVAV